MDLDLCLISSDFLPDLLNTKNKAASKYCVIDQPIVEFTDITDFKFQVTLKWTKL